MSTKQSALTSTDLLRNVVEFLSSRIVVISWDRRRDGCILSVRTDVEHDADTLGSTRAVCLRDAHSDYATRLWTRLSKHVSDRNAIVANATDFKVPYDRVAETILDAFCIVAIEKTLPFEDRVAVELHDPEGEHLLGASGETVEWCREYIATQFPAWAARKMSRLIGHRDYLEGRIKTANSLIAALEAKS